MDVILSPAFRHPFQPSNADGNSKLNLNRTRAQVFKFNERFSFFEPPPSFKLSRK